MLAWARDTAGFSIDEAANKLGLSSSKKMTGSEKLSAFEAGTAKPTRTQLLRLAKIYHRPLTTFYRDTPPRKADRGEDFRMLPGHTTPREEALLDALLRDIRVRQDLVRSIIEDDEDAKQLPFIGSLLIDTPAVLATNQIRATLDLEAEDWTHGFNSSNALFTYLRNKIENLGVFVLLIGNLGSRHSKIETKIFRGFTISDSLAPFIIINEHDARTASIFTLAHELVHLFVGTTGISADPSIQTPHTQTARIERFCNDVAGELLLPTTFLNRIEVITSIDQARAIISSIAEERKLSEPMVAYRLQRKGRLEDGIYPQLNAIYNQRGTDQQQNERDTESTSGPSYYTVRKHRLGKALLGLVGRTLRENQLTHTTAAKVLGVKPSSVEPLLQRTSNFTGSLNTETGG